MNTAYRVALVAFLSLAAFASGGCMPDRLARFDGQSVGAQLEKKSEEKILVKGEHGEELELASGWIRVEFKIDRIGNSALILRAGAHAAHFEMTKDTLNRSSDSQIRISSTESGQAQDLVINETSSVLKKWFVYREVSDPVYTTQCSPDANGVTTCKQVQTGTDETYFRDEIGLVRRGFELQLEQHGKLVATATAAVLTAEERLSETRISYYEYQRNRRQ